MSSEKVFYPGPGCLVEFMQGNSPALACVLEEQGGRLRLYTQNKRETSLPSTRLLPWSGPGLGQGLSRQSMDTALEAKRTLREKLAEEVDLEALWELVQGEVDKVSVDWLASLVWEKPDIDHLASLGRALLNNKTHFRFSPPEFEVFPQTIVANRIAEAETVKEREAISQAGTTFFHILWDIHSSRRGPLDDKEVPGPELASHLKSILLSHIADPEKESDPLWKLLTKGLPDSPHLPLYLATAWKIVPDHYNFWLDRADYAHGESWADVFSGQCAAMLEQGPKLLAPIASETSLLLTIDPATTKDRDDGFYVVKQPDGSFLLTIALACPAALWPFDSPFDKAVARRATSLYLPEGDEHMLPESVGLGLFGLDEGVERPALLLDMHMSPEGECLSCAPRIGKVTVSANLHLEECEAVLAQADFLAEKKDPSAFGAPSPQAKAHADMLYASLALAQKLQEKRIASGAVITERPDPLVTLDQSQGQVKVTITNQPEPHLAHLIVGEIMVAANAALAAWAASHNIALLYRTQDVALPKEFAGVWTTPQDIARVVRSLPPAGLETQPKRHTGLGLSAYATFSSPIRRYVDLLNQGQIVSFLQQGTARYDKESLDSMLPLLLARLEAVTAVQRFRPRYWKLLFFRQQGDKQWWDAIVTEENESFVSISLPWAQLFLRGRRKLFGDKAYPGQEIQVRIGKVNPLLNEIQIVETQEA